MLNPSVAEEAFRYIADAKSRHDASTNGTSEPWVPFKGLDIKVAEWEPRAEGPIFFGGTHRYMYCCRWADRARRKVDRVGDSQIYRIQDIFHVSPSQVSARTQHLLFREYRGYPTGAHGGDGFKTSCQPERCPARTRWIFMAKLPESRG
ncbi:unnamed protein product [Aspergillus oryzae]|nr:unnamed protein product [Aspergillus oryzae]